MSKTLTRNTSTGTKTAAQPTLRRYKSADAAIPSVHLLPLNKPEQWVSEAIKRTEFKEKSITNEFNPRDLKLNGHLQINGKPLSPSYLRVYATPGGGSCLIYSFLIALSPSFRSLGTTGKANIGNLYREMLSKNDFFTAEEKEDLSKTSRNLSQQIGMKISKFLNVNMFFLSDLGIDAPGDYNKQIDNVMILNHNGHFDAVKLPEMTEIASQEFFESVGNISVRIPDPVTPHLPSINKMRETCLMLGADDVMVWDAFADEFISQSDEYVAQRYMGLMGMLGGKRRVLRRKSRTARKSNKKRMTRKSKK